MLSVLFISQSVSFSQEFESLVDGDEGLKSKVRVKQATSIEDANKWIELNDYNLVLFDNTLNDAQLINFVVECWVREPVPICAYFSKKKANKQTEGLFSLGVEDCSGDACFEKMLNLLNKIPKVLSLLNNTHSSVLVLEDLDSPRDIICALIQSLGYPNVVGVGNANLAIKLLLDAPFDYFAVVSDINLPQKSGFAFVKELRSILSISYLPVIVLTSDPSESNLLEALKCGVTGFLAKPPKKNLLKAELLKAKRIVTLGKDPQIGTSEEITMLEKTIKVKK